MHFNSRSVSRKRNSVNRRRCEPKSSAAAKRSALQGSQCLPAQSDFMAKRPTFMTTGDISKYTKAPNLLERVMKTIRKIATASAVAFSAFAFSATPGSAARVERSITPPQHTAFTMMQATRNAASQAMRSARRRLPAGLADAMPIDFPIPTMKVFEALVPSKYRDPVTDMRSPAAAEAAR